MLNSFTTGLIAPADEFDDVSPEDPRQMVVMGAVIRVVEIYVSALIWMNLLLVAAAMLLSLVPGYCLGGAPVTFRAIPHEVFLTLNMLALVYALQATRLTSTLNLNGGQSELLVAVILMLFSVVANMIHLIALILECVQRTSIMAVQGFPFLVVLTVGVGCVFGWQVLIALRLWVLRSTRANAMNKGWTPGKVLALIDLEGYTIPPSSSSGDATPGKSSSFFEANVKAGPLSASTSLGTNGFRASLSAGTASSIGQQQSSFSPSSQQPPLFAVSGSQVVATGSKYE